MDKTTQILDSKENLTYRLSAKATLIIAIVSTFNTLLVLSVVSFSMGGDPVALWIMIWLILPLAILSTMSFSQVKIDNEGIHTFPMFLTKWDDVLEAKITHSFGLKYMRVTTRSKWKNFHLILNRKGPRPIEEVLKEKSPAGNPIHQLFASDS